MARRKARPLAVLCGLVMVAWGCLSVAALIGQISFYNEVDWAMFDAGDTQSDLAYAAALAAPAVGLFVGLWGFIGLFVRPPLHIGAMVLLLAVAIELVGNWLLVDQFNVPDYGMAERLEGYWDAVTFSTGLETEEWRAFFISLPLLTSPVVLLLWLLVLVSGAGRKYPPHAQGPTYGGSHHGQQPYGGGAPFQAGYQPPSRAGDTRILPPEGQSPYRSSPY